MTQKRVYRFKDGKVLELGKHTLVMGILNVTPDSFSDGGKWFAIDKAVQHAKDMVEQGADIIDVGAESSRPGFVPVSAEEEIKRLRPFLEALVPQVSVPISIDTFKSETAKLALDMGVHMINDIWGLQYKEEPGCMAQVAASYDVPVVVMHNQVGTEYKDILEDMKAFFIKSIKVAQQAGIREENLILDPGIGFGKTYEQNLAVLRHMEVLTNELPFPWLLGASRKGFIGLSLDLPVEERMEGTGAVCVMGQMKGCQIMRVHDVKEIKRMCQMVDVVERGGKI